MSENIFLKFETIEISTNIFFYSQLPQTGQRQSQRRPQQIQELRNLKKLKWGLNFPLLSIPNFYFEIWEPFMAFSAKHSFAFEFYHSTRLTISQHIFWARKKLKWTWNRRMRIIVTCMFSRKPKQQEIGISLLMFDVSWLHSLNDDRTQLYDVKHLRK